jgi:hypothetical protein
LALFGAVQASFDAVTPGGTTQKGTVIDLGVVQDGFFTYVLDAGSGDDAYIGFDGSVDGTNWYSLTGGDTLITGPDIRTDTAGPARYVRASGRTSSGSPVLTASVATLVC